VSPAATPSHETADSPASPPSLSNSDWIGVQRSLRVGSESGLSHLDLPFDLQYHPWQIPWSLENGAYLTSCRKYAVPRKGTVVAGARKALALPLFRLSRAPTQRCTLPGLVLIILMEISTALTFLCISKSWSLLRHLNGQCSSI